MNFENENIQLVRNTGKYKSYNSVALILTHHESINWSFLELANYEKKNCIRASVEPNLEAGSVFVTCLMRTCIHLNLYSFLSDGEQNEY